MSECRHSGAVIPKWHNRHRRFYCDHCASVHAWEGRNAGSKNGHAKLTEDDVLSIRASSATQDVLARRYDVAQSLISRIRSRVIWRHV